MTHIELTFHFRRVRSKFRFSNIEADLYYEIIALWASDDKKENPFQYPNALLCATLGISEKSLIAARNRIKQAGLIDFQSGHKRYPSVYEIKGANKIGLLKVSKNGSVNGSINGSINGNHTGGNGSDPLEKKKKKEEEEKKERDEAFASALERVSFLENALTEKEKGEMPPSSAAPPKKTVAVFQPPTRDEVKLHFVEKTGVNGQVSLAFAETFIAHYTNTDWRYGKAKHKMSDWKAAMRSSWDLAKFIKAHQGDHNYSRPKQAQNTYEIVTGIQNGEISLDDYKG